MGVLGFHVIGTTYGFWLPNDERGSGSRTVRAEHLKQFGAATRVDHARSVAGKPYDYEVRRLARSSLKYPYVEFNGAQALSVARGIARELEAHGGAVHAFSVMPTHFHAVVGPHRYDIRRFVGRLRGAATRQLKEDGLHPLSDFREKDGTTPSPWGRLPWIVYLWTDKDIRRAIRYVQDNPQRQKLPRQTWSFVTPWVPNNGED